QTCALPVWIWPSRSAPRLRAFAFTFPWGLSCESVSAQGPVAWPADIACPVRIAAHHACGAVGKRSGQPLAAAAGRTTGTASPAGVRRRAAVAGLGFFADSLA